MAADGSSFVTDGELLYAYCTANASKFEWEACAAQSGGKLTLPDGDTPGT